MVESDVQSSCWSPLLEKAFRIAASAHDGQTRKASSLPYFSHPAAVAMILLRAGFESDELLAAAVLHDALEDTALTVEELQAEFPPGVAAIVAGASEKKFRDTGEKRPWGDRKQEHIQRLKLADVETRAVVLADKLHNLSSMVADLGAGQPLWERFNASRADVLWYYDSIVAAALDAPGAEELDTRLGHLAGECRVLVDQLRHQSVD